MERATDVVVIGAGVFGLWTALWAARRGLSVAVVEGRRAGAGASGGLLGALTPHRPTGWRALKAFQLEALLGMEAAVAGLEAETGVGVGYRRTGRIVPLGDAEARLRAEQDAEAARERWGGAATFRVEDGPAREIAGALDGQAFAAGAAVDTLSASVDPRRLMAALATAVRRRGALHEGWPVAEIDPARGRVSGPRGMLSGGHVVIAAGWEGAPLLRASGAAEGRPVKGQAALLSARLPEAMPVLHGRGLFVVRHGPERVAVGSTSEPGRWDTATDGALDELLGRAGQLCPPLGRAPVLERWAGVRPRPPGREPVVGRLPGQARVWVATGGYKIGLGLAHLAGEALAAAIADDPAGPAIPAEFAPMAAGPD